MKRLTILFALCLTMALPAHAGGDLTRQTPNVVEVNLGSETGEMVFQPSKLEFETGKLYRLVLINNSPHPHYFSSVGLARSVFTRKAQTYAPNGDRTAEIKGQIQEIEVFPGHRAEWWFVPVQTGEFNDLVCSVSGHEEAGMTGSIKIY
ncbi:MAG: plastocyanin/azurin family copper-binding protein [Marinobacter sp.]|uniref:plastocyanin/azurin family copper-binding protein n=1 Tax=Marinobacter sp. TaxID=50741 RepID=UPI003C42D399